MELQVKELEIHLEVELFHHRESKMGSAAIGFAGLNLAELAFHRPRPGGFRRTPRSTLRHARVRRSSPAAFSAASSSTSRAGRGRSPCLRGLSRPGSCPRAHRRRLDRRRAVADCSRVLRRRYRPPQLLPGRRTLAVECRCRFQGAIPGERHAVRFAWHLLAGDVHRERSRIGSCRMSPTAVITHFNAVLDIEPGDYESQTLQRSLGTWFVRIRGCQHPLPAADALRWRGWTGPRTSPAIRSTSQ